MGVFSEKSQKLLDHVETVASPMRPDRLFPSDPALFETNGVSVAYGSAGVLLALSQCGQRIPGEYIDWTRKAVARDMRALPVGLFLGLAGVAWVLLTVGCVDDGRALLDELLVRRKGLNPRSCEVDVAIGLAGLGLTFLQGYLQLHEQRLLEGAVDVGTTLLAKKLDVGSTTHWTTRTGRVAIGYGHGASGIALFLLYLWAVSREKRFLDAGRAALAFDLGQSLSDGFGGRTWRMWSDSNVVVPYFESGTAGVLAVLLRYRAACSQYRQDDATLDAMVDDVTRRFAISPSLYGGLSGLGNVLIDCSRLIPHKRGQFMDRAREVASGVDLFLIRRGRDLLCTGAENLRCSCDYATGSSGVARFLYRLEHDSTDDFFLDGVLTADGGSL